MDIKVQIRVLARVLQMVSDEDELVMYLDNEVLNGFIEGGMIVAYEEDRKIELTLKGRKILEDCNNLKQG